MKVIKKLLTSLNKNLQKDFNPEKYIKKSFGSQSKVVYSEENTTRKVFSTIENGVTIIRLDSCFRNASKHVYKNIISFLKDGNEEAKAFIIHWVQIHQEAKRAQHPYQKNVDQIIKKFFPALPEISLKWGKRGKRSKQHSIRLASFWPHKKEIVLHPFAEDMELPLFYIDYLLFHELCHAQLIFSGKAIDCQHHGPDFKELELQFPKFEEAMAWEKEQLPEFLKKYSEL